MAMAMAKATAMAVCRAAPTAGIHLATTATHRCPWTTRQAVQLQRHQQIPATFWDRGADRVLEAVMATAQTSEEVMATVPQLEAATAPGSTALRRRSHLVMHQLACFDRRPSLTKRPPHRIPNSERRRGSRRLSQPRHIRGFGPSRPGQRLNRPRRAPWLRPKCSDWRQV